MKVLLVSVIGLLTALLNDPGVVAQTPSGRAGGLMTPAQFKALPSKPADFRLSYGTDANQFGELRVPSDAGFHPVAILIHGGCWKAEYADLRDLSPMADALKAKGIATWNIEFRRLGQADSGWPGTYLDVGRGVDYLRSIAVQNHLDLTRVIVVGHSVGGTLALWVSARSHLPKSSPIYARDPLPVRGVIDVAGIVNMDAVEQVCGPGVVEQMLGGKRAEVPKHDAQTSPVKMLPLGVPQVLILGGRDQFVPVSLLEKYPQAAKDAGDPARLVSLPEAGHFEVVSPFSSAWLAVEAEILSLLAKP